MELKTPSTTFYGLTVSDQARTVSMFSGQGFQYYTMGKTWYESESVFRQWMNYLDNLAHSYRSPSIVKALYFNGKIKGETFDDISYTRPALFMVQKVNTAFHSQQIDAVKHDLTDIVSKSTWTTAKLPLVS